MKTSRLLSSICMLVLVGMPPTEAQAQAPETQAEPAVLHACYVPIIGVVYRIKTPLTSQACFNPNHVEFSWTDGLPGHDHGALNGLADDDHPEYVREGEAAGGDLAGSYPAPAVAGLQGRPLSAAVPSDGQVLGWNAAAGEWTPATSGGGGVTDHGALAGLSDDDHGQYLLVDGVRNATDGFAVTGTPFTGTIPTSGAGTRLMWYPGKAAFRAGKALGTEWDDVNIGANSVAMGVGTEASGVNSVAMGIESTASGSSSTALGNSTAATGALSRAIGQSSTASGDFSVVIGNHSTAAGAHSLAMGFRANAAHQGAFVYGDKSTNTETVTSTAANSFVVRAAGGTRFYSNTLLSSGVSLAAGGGAWSTLSDRGMKENFEERDGEDVLERIARMPIQEWNYRSQDPSIRHLGPTAQDFRAAFRLGESDRTITTSDIDGVNMLAIQALGKRTAELRAENDELRAENDELRDRLSRLEALLGVPR